MTQFQVSVVIAAWNAEASIARAIASALAEPEVVEVVVVDDASTDATVARAERGCDGTGRLKVLRQPTNRGPAAARNRAVAETTASCIAILDSDDFFVPGRFATLFSLGECDAAIDNIAFVQATALPDFDTGVMRSFSGTHADIGLCCFVEGNMVRPGRPRAELGFIKPMLSREFLRAHQIDYDETLRLGEDYILYARMLAAGARFRMTKACGYVAVERDDSLSGQHSADDLAALLAADLALANRPELSGSEKAAIARHADQLAGKIHYRRLLDQRKTAGLGPALLTAAMAPRRLPGVVAAYARDQGRPNRPADPRSIRYLFD